MATPQDTVRYRGVKYRSRLDAKWAAVFHHLNWEVVYDPHTDGRLSFLVREPDPAGELATLVKPGEFYVLVNPEITEPYRLYGVWRVGQAPPEWARPVWNKATNDIMAVA